MGRAAGGFILIAIGVSILLGFDLLHFFFPVLLIALGIMLLTKRNSFDNRPSVTNTAKETSKEAENEATDKIDEVYVFSGTKKRIQSHSFNGGRVITVFGGVDLDLRDVKVPAGKAIEMEIVAVLGGIRIQVPGNWSIASAGMHAVLGGFDNRAHTDSEKAIKVLVRGSAVLGGIEIYY